MLLLLICRVMLTSCSLCHVENAFPLNFAWRRSAQRSFHISIWGSSRDHVTRFKRDPEENKRRWRRIYEGGTETPLGLKTMNSLGDLACEYFVMIAQMYRLKRTTFKYNFIKYASKISPVAFVNPRSSPRFLLMKSLADTTDRRPPISLFIKRWTSLSNFLL